MELKNKRKFQSQGDKQKSRQYTNEDNIISGAYERLKKTQNEKVQNKMSDMQTAGKKN